MLKFFLKVIAFLLLVSIGLYFLNKGFWSNNPYDTNKFDDVPYNIQICNIGASHSMYSFNYEDYEDDYTCFNFGLKLQRHSYDERIMEYYKDHFAEGCIVFIIVTYPMILGIDDYDSADFVSLNKRYYTFLPSDLIEAYDQKTAIEVKYAPAAYFGDAGEILRGVVSWLQDKSVYYNKYWDRTADEIDINADLDKKYKMHFVTDRRDENGNIIFSQEEISSIYEMIGLCKEIGAVPVLVTSPFLDDYLDMVEKKEPDFVEQFNNLMLEISGETDVQWCDFSHDSRFKDYDLFLDIDHLNKEGARLFTDMLIEDVTS